MATLVPVCGKSFDGVADTPSAPAETLVENDIIVELAPSVSHPADESIIDLSDRMVTPGFTDTHLHHCIDSLNLKWQTLPRTGKANERSSRCVISLRPQPWILS
ncbi:hypothetical protein QU481_20925 [Crenobacter sp. SG2303]|uniref:Amidohydrolase 3 domain-containing protein n=1 Tax=Crenobacter oryzisoli TaxID=3056844 RepID=A0ABT7XU38_9NEIS|nr:hypothetical protein [Crenobacter sp. SG2303]MDN0077301.1 hypothetical protein [Crenobacter sp. SG2303]